MLARQDQSGTGVRDPFHAPQVVMSAAHGKGR